MTVLFAAVLCTLAPLSTASASEPEPLATLDLVTLEPAQGDAGYFEKLEGTISLGTWHLEVLPQQRDTRQIAVTVPFTLHPAREGVYQRLRLAIVLDEPMVVIDLLPSVLDSAAGPTVRAPDDPLTTHCRPAGLEPTTRAYGLGERSVSWTLERRSGLSTGSKSVCMLVEAPPTLDTLTARIVVDAEIGRSLLPLSKPTVPKEITRSWSLDP